MRKTAYVLIPLIGITLAACESRSEKANEAESAAPAETPAPTPPATPAPEMTPLFTSNATGSGAGSSIQGQVKVMPGTDATSFKVDVNLTGVPAGAHDWHIHKGTCEKAGPVVVPFTADKDKAALSSPIEPAADGAVTVTADVPSSILTVDQLRSGDYSLHVHEKSNPTNHGPTIACSNLKG